MSIHSLLKAAEFIERRDREAEHGYASSMPEQNESVRRKMKPKKSQENRSAHNELEKNRRADLRNYLEKLKELVPLGPETSRHTTLGLLIKATAFIKTLKEKEKKNLQQIWLLRKQHRVLKHRFNKMRIHELLLTHKMKNSSEYSSDNSVWTSSGSEISEF